tara:strand:- start:802 stop:1596 length:795 start_codon:yes stop_codon:yes gene_type:complete
MILLIDNREPTSITYKIIELNNETKYSIQVQQLEVGDFCFYDDIEKKPVIIFERKSLQDLDSSIKDGRYNEQSLRLSNVDIHNHNIYYIIEGNIGNYRNRDKIKTLRSSIVSLSYYKGFSVINTIDANDTANTLYNFFDKIMKEKKREPYYKPKLIIDKNMNNDDTNEKQEQQDNNDIEYVKNLKNQKKSQITKNNILAIMLNQIPSVSSLSSIAITHIYKSLDELMYVLKNDPDKISEICLENGRRINKNIVHNLKHYLIRDE